MCAHTLGHVDCWYLNKLFLWGGVSGSSLLPTKVFSEASFLPAPISQGSFKYNQFVKSCSKTSRWNPQADAIIFLRDDGRHLFPCSEKIGLCGKVIPGKKRSPCRKSSPALCISKLKGPGGRWWAGSWDCCVLCRAAMVRNGVREEFLTFPVSGTLLRNGNRSFVWRTPSGSYVPHRLKAWTSPDHCRYGIYRVWLDPAM